VSEVKHTQFFFAHTWEKQKLYLIRRKGEERGKKMENGNKFLQRKIAKYLHLIVTRSTHLSLQMMSVDCYGNRAKKNVFTKKGGNGIGQREQKERSINNLGKGIATC
jgi:hypothetical protein